MNISDRDTIVAVSTGPAEGAIGIVRLSGPAAVQIADRCFRGKRSLQQTGDRRITQGWLRAAGQDLDEVLVSVMRSPRSYTGEDMVEFNCHGGLLLLRRAVGALVSAGARRAERGEFTRRAYLNDRIDLTQAEAVADMISARGDLGLKSAFFQLRGGLRHRFERMAEALRQTVTLLEAGLDFSEELAVDPDSVLEGLAAVRKDVDLLVASYRQGKVLREGIRVVLAGGPNVGKSSLMNMLLQQDRAIVTEIPGTTRDTIEEGLSLNGLRVTLVDTAGLRPATDPVEEEGTRRSRLSIGEAELVLAVVDGSDRPGGEDTRLLQEVRGKAVLAVNKRDLGRHPKWDEVARECASVSTSAVTGEGMDALREAIRSRALGEGPCSPEVLTQERHVDALKVAKEALDRAERALGDRLPGELAAFEVRTALDALGEIVGETAPEDVLDRIFATFCVGK